MARQSAKSSTLVTTFAQPGESPRREPPVQRCSRSAWPFRGSWRALATLLAAWIGLALAAPATTSAQDRRDVAAQHWVDGSGSASIDEASGAFARGAGRPVDSSQVMPLRPGTAVWYRLDLPAVDVRTRAALRVEFAGIDSVELFRADAAGRWQSQRAGDSLPVAKWPAQHLQPAFIFAVQPGEIQPTYLRVRNAQPVRVNWVYETADTLARSSELWHLAAGAYGGIVFLVVLVSLFAAVSWRDPVHVYYGIHVVLVALSVMALTGFGGTYLWPDHAWWNDKAPMVVPFLALAWAGLFVRELVAERGRRLVSALLIAHVTACLALVIAFLVVGRENFYRAPSVYGIPGLLLVVGILAWYSLRRPEVGRWVFAGIAALAAGSLLPMLHTLGVLPGSFLVRNGVPIGSALEIPLVLAGLFFRSSERRETRLRSQALDHTDPLTGLGNQRVLLRALDKLLLKARRDRQQPAVLRIHVRNLGDLRAEYGREAADAALLRAAECVAVEARENDVVAREQGSDLVLLLAGDVTRTQAIEAGRNIIARGLKYSPRLPPGVTLQLAVTGAAAPLPDTDAAGLLDLLARLMLLVTNDPQGRAMRFLGSA